MLRIHCSSTRPTVFSALLLCLLLFSHNGFAAGEDHALPDERVSDLVNGLDDGELKSTLAQCSSNTPTTTTFSIAHRGAPLHYPEHTKEGYIAAAKMGAGMIECDVTFTSDQALVCRHSQCDLHTSTNILETPLAARCSTPPDNDSTMPYSDVKCCTSDLTVEEFKSLRGKKDYGNKKARTLDAFLFPDGGNESRYPTYGTLMTHAESITLFDSLGVKMIPELKAAQVAMPYKRTYTQQHYAQALVDEYVAAGIDAGDVYLQSFNVEDLVYWIGHTPAFAENAVLLDGRYTIKSFNIEKSASWQPSMTELADLGIKTLAPPMWMLLALDDDNIVASAYAKAAKAAGLQLVTWTLERSGSLKRGGGWYYQTVSSAIDKDSDTLVALDVLVRDVGVLGVFSDWPATTTYYDNCMGMH